MSDDSGQVAPTHKLIDYAILATMDLLKKNAPLTPDLKTKHMSLLLGVCLEMVVGRVV